ncbi:hypothetical protein HPB49_009334 [Dermacentor silvarum]|uniref:Uncharacterized protein n=1 Tax=Dermacentor silvarum TaxID=543639 RepID=A0ACB8DBM3_DERSI|nr:hypothetical protein HPB49_009334 [Dermacentor silvarum]
MRRAETLESAQNIIFVDSTSSCDVDGNIATILLTATKAGAVPVAVLIHRGQSREAYRLAFELLKQKYPKCFGNNEAPGAFISDNARAEKDALRDVWPSARQLLCQFHVLQAEWRWLKSAHNIGKEERRQLMAAFQKILYAKDEHELETAIAELQSIPHALCSESEHVSFAPICTAGSQGAFCKHQAAVQQAFGGAFPNSPELTAADRIELGQLALGERCPAVGFFMPLTAHDAAVAPSSSEHEAGSSTSYDEGGCEERTSFTEPESDVITKRSGSASKNAQCSHQHSPLLKDFGVDKAVAHTKIHVRHEGGVVAPSAAGGVELSWLCGLRAQAQSVSPVP